MPALILTHSSCLRAADFVPFVTAPLRNGAYRDTPIEALLGARPSRTLIPTPTGRHALWYFLALCGDRLERGDEVIVGGYNFYVIVRLLIQRGLTPVFADVEPGTLCLDPVSLRARITPRTRLVLVTHMFGNPADMAAIRAVCDEHGLLLFEDCAHAVGTLGADGAPVGQSGDGALFSFGIHKIVNTFGGGALAVRHDLYNPDALPAHRPSRTESWTGTLSRAVASVAMFPGVGPWIFQPVIDISRTLARLGSPRLSRVLEPARDNPEYRFAADERAPFRDFMRPMLALQLRRLEENVARRRAVRAGVRERLADVSAIGWLDEDTHGRSNAAYFGIRVPAPADLARFLMARGVMSNPREFYDCSRLPQFASSAATCGHSARLSDELLRLPSYPDLTAAQIDRIADGIRAYFARPVTTA